ncbi:LysR family transcriptional regulator [Rhodopseudomonas sp. HC1]|uniref:LysR family transcriptional regulator n=1 Tax=Rhodopseudomonas infernalis TaxID=2897386 RepID=UPI001EE90D14|nr:LysR family transcriptional regulator [Rhodopseudomonas infernalis]MCG6204249.1 LysR family transcriptional regulator [Rhodopseudomonas infernalis]
MHFSEAKMLRKPAANIPIDVVRTVVAIAETGSLSKAAARLNLTQPAISAQIRRLQGIVGGELFIRGANGTMLTELGKLALQHARRILESNDQLLRLCGSDLAPVLRLGMSQLLAPLLFEDLKRERLSNVFLLAERANEIQRGLTEGFIDVACLFLYDRYQPEVDRMIVRQAEIDTCWIKSKAFVLSPGAPVPLVTHPGDEWIVGSLDRAGTGYRVIMSSTDSAARLSAVRAGLGITAIPSPALPPDLVKAHDYYLPKLAQARLVVCKRDGLSDPSAEQLISWLWQLFGRFVGTDDCIIAPAPAIVPCRSTRGRSG